MILIKRNETHLAMRVAQEIFKRDPQIQQVYPSIMFSKLLECLHGI